MIHHIIQVSRGGDARLFAPTNLLPEAALHVLGKVVDVILGLAEGNRKHELPLRRGVEPEGRKFQSNNLTGVDEVDDSAAVYGVSGQSVRMPCENTGGLPVLDAGNHIVEDRTARLFRCLAFHELTDNFQMFFYGKLAEFGQLRFDAQNLAVWFVGRFTGVEEEGHGSIITEQIVYTIATDYT
ncbi:hypothetical protein M1506_02980 [Patescibacteria group bacterium]|nr:hypothetical protein [Patescibacteria group bacterium]